jgi:esterase/lipase/1-acyl-sn-glycerol-3-phosphate acyltransferase
MNRIAYLTTGLAIKALSGLSKARINFHGEENIPDGPLIFVINHFTRLETMLMPYHIHRLTELPAWSLADSSLFKGSFGTFLDKVGAVSTKDPDRDRMIVKSLLSGKAAWIIYPEGRMVKSKKILEKGRYMISYAGGKHPPHTGAATLALRTEFYRQRLKRMSETVPDEAQRLLSLFQIESMESISKNSTHIVPVNLTYYPIRAKENFLNVLANHLAGDIPERMAEEIMMEGSMLLSGVDVDIRFGEPLDIEKYISLPDIQDDISSQGKIDFDDLIPSLKKMRRLSVDIMQRYMSAIYEMTTVNHDHLFASILRMHPYKEIDAYALRQRVFLCASQNLKKMGIYCHRNLEDDQIHLLTDDHFNQFNDFVSIAVEKNVLKKEEKSLEKNSLKFSSAFDFHRIRVDNPIGVMANEIEPLIPLQRYLRRLSWAPLYWVRKKIVKHFIRKGLAEYEKDYTTFYVEGESKKKDVGRPFLLKSGRTDIGVVLIHGYMAAPLEVGQLAEYLAGRGFSVYAPRLKGHGTSPDDLATRSYKDWINSVDEGYAIMRSLCRRVVTGGFSTGAGLALDLAARVKDVEGVFAVSPPIRLQDISSKLVPAVDVWNRMMKKVHWEGAQKEFIDNEPENPHINYHRNPISGVRELERLMESIASRLPHLKSPALIVQSQGDPVVDPEGSKRAFEMIGSKDKEYLLFNFERHGIILGEGAHRVHRSIGDFIENLSRSETAGM